MDHADPVAQFESIPGIVTNADDRAHNFRARNQRDLP
jgi:hypothetical protein